MNYAESTNLMHGVIPNGVVYYGQFDRLREINERVAKRNIPDSALPPNFNPRPVLTKYALFPMLDNRMPATVPIESNMNYSLETNFTPPVMQTGPVSGFINHVDTETHLRNQYFALQKGAPQGVYVPSSNSDLYKVEVVSRPEVQPYPLLFSQPVFEKNPHPNMISSANIGRDTFSNSTRTQLRNTMIQG
jgi:hypothetical protein